mmetsp:Transcript_55144/g.175404  ORF Transcript_55144/g.175404 Transcript_55144/m.175404 type:complete len:98 (+) Transcript_55144:49-342(+)
MSLNGWDDQVGSKQHTALAEQKKRLDFETVHRGAEAANLNMKQVVTMTKAGSAAHKLDKQRKESQELLMKTMARTSQQNLKNKYMKPNSSGKKKKKG